MKKLILLLSVFTLTLTSCSSDDDDSSSQDPLVGAWNYYKYFENGVEEALDECEAEETLVFNSDGTFTFTYYELNNANQVCEIIVDETETGTWINSGNGSYSLTDDVETITENIIFDGNTFYFEDTYNDGTMDFTDRYVYIKQ